MVSNPINVRNPIKGTAMLDPLYPHLLYVGHGVAAERPWGCMTFNIQTGQQIQFFKEDSKAWRRWGAYDSSPLRVDKFVFRPGENGTLYKWYIQNDTILLHSTLRYTCKGKAPGMEASMTVYKNYGYTADNHGNILCTNLNSLQPVWHYYNHDDTDASLVMEVDEDADSTPYLYSGCEVDYQGSNGFCYLIKLNAIDGSKVWERKIPCKKIPRGEKFTEGGIFATPLPGKGNCSDRLYICCITNTPAHHGDFMAIDKKTGEIIYSTHLDWYPWMSPISFLNENNEEFIVAGDTQGKLYLINGKTGEIIYKNKVALNFESSPAVRGNSFVLGSRGTQIYKFHIE
jgi:outer membrane protein assembly factor BamB